MFSTWVIPINLKYCLFLAEALKLEQKEQKIYYEAQKKNQSKSFSFLTRLRCTASGKPRHSQRHKLRMDHFDECTTGVGGKESRSNGELVAAVSLLKYVLQSCFDVFSFITHLSSHLTLYLCSYLNTEMTRKDGKVQDQKMFGFFVLTKNICQQFIFRSFFHL